MAINLKNIKGKQTAAGKQYEALIKAFLAENDAEDLREEIERELEKIANDSTYSSTIQYVKTDLEKDIRKAIFNVKIDLEMSKKKKTIVYTQEEVDEMIAEALSEKEEQLKEAQKRIEELESQVSTPQPPQTPPPTPTKPPTIDSEFFPGFGFDVDDTGLKGKGYVTILRLWLRQVTSTICEFNHEIQYTPRIDDLYNSKKPGKLNMKLLNDLEHLLQNMLNKNYINEDGIRLDMVVNLIGTNIKGVGQMLYNLVEVYYRWFIDVYSANKTDYYNYVGPDKGDDTHDLLEEIIDDVKDTITEAGFQYE